MWPYLSLEKSRALHLNKLGSPSFKDALCQVWLKLVQWFLRRFFKISSMYFRYFVIISPLKMAGPFIWTNLNPLHPRMLCAKFGWNWHSGSWEEDENVKSLQTDRRRTDDRWSEKLTWVFSSGELTIILYSRNHSVQKLCCQIINRFLYMSWILVFWREWKKCLHLNIQKKKIS